jgi:hypothetical protein
LAEYNGNIGTAGLITRPARPAHGFNLWAGAGRARPDREDAAMTDKPGAVPPPQCKAILLCERVEVDRLTRQLDLRGVFCMFHLDTFPGRTMPFTVFTLLTGGEGEQHVWVDVYDLRDGQHLVRSRSDPVPFPGRADYIFWQIALPPLLLPAAGRYDLVVACANGEIDRLSFAATTRLE